MLICLVGKSGSGKSYIANLLCTYSDSILTIDIDKIGHAVTNKETVFQKLVETFGSKIQKNGIIDRKELGKIVFNNEESMKKLESITWSSMELEIDSIIEENPNKIILLDWLLLPKTKYFKTCDLKILVTAPTSIRAERTMKRDNITKEKFLERDGAAISLKEEEYDYVISNVDSEHTKKEVYRIYEESIIHR